MARIIALLYLVSCIVLLIVAADAMCEFESSLGSGSGVKALPDGWDLMLYWIAYIIIWITTVWAWWQHIISQTCHRSRECLELNADHLSLLHSGCTRFMSNRCYLIHSNETVGYRLINHTLDAFVDSIATTIQRSDSKVSTWCGEVLFSLACNSVYFGCDPETSLPMGLCKETCSHYLTLGNCSQFFADVIHTMNEDKASSGFRINLNCSTDSVFSPGDNVFNFVGDMSNNCYEGIVKNLSNYSIIFLTIALSVYTSK